MLPVTPVIDKQSNNPTRCIVPKCTSMADRYTIFEMPECPKTLKLWKKALDFRRVRSGYGVCQLHFDKEVLVEVKHGMLLMPGVVPNALPPNVQLEKSNWLCEFCENKGRGATIQRLKDLCLQEPALQPVADLCLMKTNAKIIVEICQACVSMFRFIAGFVSSCHKVQLKRSSTASLEVKEETPCDESVPFQSLNLQSNDKNQHVTESLEIKEETPSDKSVPFQSMNVLNNDKNQRVTESLEIKEETSSDESVPFQSLNVLNNDKNPRVTGEVSEPTDIQEQADESGDGNQRIKEMSEPADIQYRIDESGGGMQVDSPSIDTESVTIEREELHIKDEIDSDDYSGTEATDIDDSDIDDCAPDTYPMYRTSCMGNKVFVRSRAPFFTVKDQIKFVKLMKGTNEIWESKQEGYYVRNTKPEPWSIITGQYPKMSSKQLFNEWKCLKKWYYQMRDKISKDKAYEATISAQPSVLYSHLDNMLKYTFPSFSVEQHLKLASLVAHANGLWNRSHTDFLSIETRREQWKDIAGTLRMTTDRIIREWKRLQFLYQKYKKSPRKKHTTQIELYQLLDTIFYEDNTLNELQKKIAYALTGKKSKTKNCVGPFGSLAKMKELLEEIRMHETIWNKKNPDFGNTEQSVWQNLAKKFNTDTETVMQQWECLRDLRAFLHIEKEENLTDSFNNMEKRLLGNVPCSYKLQKMNAYPFKPRPVDTKLTPYKCKIETCDAWFRVKSTRLKHMTNVHFTCKICGEKFKRVSTFDYHHATKHESLELPCSLCGKVFPHELVLQGHMNSHRKAGPCNVCGKMFSLNDLKVHKKTHHLEDTVRVKDEPDD